MQKNNSFIKAGAVLAASSMLVKILSAAYRIPLTRMLGAYSMGKYSTVFNIFMPFFALATAGITPAVSRLVAQLRAQKKEEDIKSIKNKALGIYISLGAIMTMAFIATGAVYSKSLGETIVFTGAIILAPNIIFATIEAIYKGLSQGEMDMMPTARANVLESVSKTILGLGSVYYITGGGQGIISAYSADAPILASFMMITFSGLICWVYLHLQYKAKNVKKKSTASKLVTAKTLLTMSVPISMSALTVSLVNFFDTAVCLPLIKNIPSESLIQSFGGASFKGAVEVSIFLFGTYQGMVLTVYNLIPALLSSIGTACLPVITRAQAAQDKKSLQRQAGKLFCITSALSVPMCMYTFFFCGDIISMLFGTNEAQTVIAQSLMKIIIPSGVLASFTFALNAIMHAYAKSDKVFKILLYASVAKCLLSWQLCQNPQINIRGIAISTNVFYIIVFILSTIKVKQMGVEFPLLKTFFVPVIGSYVIGFFTFILAESIFFSIPSIVRVFTTGTIFGLGYFVLMILSGFLVDI